MTVKLSAINAMRVSIHTWRAIAAEPSACVVNAYQEAMKLVEQTTEETAIGSSTSCGLCTYAQQQFLLQQYEGYCCSLCLKKNQWRVYDDDGMLIGLTEKCTDDGTAYSRFTHLEHSVSGTEFTTEGSWYTEHQSQQHCADLMLDELVEDFERMFPDQSCTIPGKE